MKLTLLAAAMAAALAGHVVGAAPAQAQETGTADRQDALPAVPSSTPLPAQAADLESVRVEGRSAETGSDASSLAERRYTGAVVEVLGSEAMSASGDSDAAAALKRVTGLTLVDSRYIYVRGLGERYSTVLLNGASVPSPDPTRRVVPLDLFPSAVLDSVVISKSSSADLPGHFGGGAVQLRTRQYPLGFSASVGIGGEYVTHSTGTQGYFYDGGKRDWTGYGAGVRRLPSALQPNDDGRSIAGRSPLDPGGLSVAELESLGEQVAAGSAYQVHRGRLDPGSDVSASIGNSWVFGDQGRIGFLAALRHKSGWIHRSEQRRSYAASGGGLQLADKFDVDGTTQDVESGGFFNAGVDFGAGQQIGFTHMLLRQSQDETQVSRGFSDSQFLERYRLRWVENQLRWDQIVGSHALPHYITLDWQWTDAGARRDEPDTREWRRDDDDQDGVYVFSNRSDGNSQTTARLRDKVRDGSVKLSMPIDFSSEVSARFSIGHALSLRNRDARMRSFSFDGRVSPQLLPLPQQDILTPGNIGPAGLVLEETTLPTDSYRARQTLRAWYAEADTTLHENWRVLLGVRLEDNWQQVVTADPAIPDASPVVALIDRRDLLPSMALTWTPGENDQWRLAYSKTVSRPDFRELSPAPFLDPQLDIITIGNPSLKGATIRHVDARWEHYFNDLDSISIGAFHKSFADPIEKTFTAGGSGQFITLRNALSAKVYGLELDARSGLGLLADTALFRSLPLVWDEYYLAANYARMRSTVHLDPDYTTQTNADRPLQGASPYVANLRFGRDSADGRAGWTLLYNVSGARIARAGVATQPDVYEHPFSQVDFVYRLAVGEHGSFKARFGNLLDPEVKYVQGGNTTRVYRKGRSIDIGFEWGF